MSILANYQQFVINKGHAKPPRPIAGAWLPSIMFDFQAALTEWGLAMGRGAIFADCGTGKTLMELVWAENVVRLTNKPVLIATPLAVAHQTIDEAAKFGIEAHRSYRGEIHPGVNVTNYEKLEHFDCSRFAGFVADESSILKNFDGVRRGQITEFARNMPYRLLCTATAAPNDFTELGTSSEALGYLGHMDMLGRFFKQEHASVQLRRSKPGATDKWRLKGHAETPFWKWVCSWARAMRRPSDLGFDDRDFILPELIERQHEVSAQMLPDGFLFSVPAVGLREQRDERRRTITERCEKAAALLDHDRQVIAWCDLNDEGDLLEKLVRGAVQVSGDDADEAKEEKFRAFASGQARGLVTKGKIGAWGLNFQNCAHMTVFPWHSFEQYYQMVRRCWRFGQKNTVIVDVISTEGEKTVLANLQRKQKAAELMFDRLVTFMREASRDGEIDRFPEKEILPSWL